MKTVAGLPARIPLNRNPEAICHENHRIAMRTCIRSGKHCLRGTERSATIQAAGGLQENPERSELQEKVSWLNPYRQRTVWCAVLFGRAERTREIRG